MQKQQRKRPVNKGTAPRKGTAPTKPQIKSTTASGAKPVQPADKQTKARDRPVPGNSPVQKEKKDRRKSDYILCAIIVALLVVIVILLLRSCKAEGEPDQDIRYEESVSPDYKPGSDDLKATDDMLNLAVLPDYVVSKGEPEVLIPYPEQNNLDIDLTFIDPYTDQILYQTAFISPGSVVSVPVYSFAFPGTHQYRVEVRAFDKKTHDIVSTDIAMETQIIKK